MNKKTSDGSTPIMWALRGTSGQHKLIFDLLLEAGADLNIQNDVSYFYYYYFNISKFSYIFCLNRKDQLFFIRQCNLDMQLLQQNFI